MNAWVADMSIALIVGVMLLFERAFLCWVDGSWWKGDDHSEGKVVDLWGVRVESLGGYFVMWQ